MLSAYWVLSSVKHSEPCRQPEEKMNLTNNCPRRSGSKALLRKRKHTWFCWGKQAEGPWVPYPEGHFASANLAPVTLQFFVTIFYISVCNTTEERCEWGVCWPGSFLTHTNAGTLRVTFEDAWEQQPNHAPIKDKIFGDWWLVNETDSSQRWLDLTESGKGILPCFLALWLTLQSALQPAFGRDSGPGVSPIPLQLQSLGYVVSPPREICFLFPGKKHLSDYKSAAYLLSLSCPWCGNDEIFCPGNAFPISMVTSNEITLPSGIKAAIRMWGPQSWSYNGKPRKPPLSLGAWGAFFVHLWKRLKKAIQELAGPWFSVENLSLPPGHSYLNWCRIDWSSL